MRIPREADERVRDVVRCRETFPREILTSRHYILTCLARRGFVVREGTNWCTPHLEWLLHLTTDASPLAMEDQLIYREYHALLLYTLPRRSRRSRGEPGALTPLYRPGAGARDPPRRPRLPGCPRARGPGNPRGSRPHSYRPLGSRVHP